MTGNHYFLRFSNFCFPSSVDFLIKDTLDSI